MKCCIPFKNLLGLSLFVLIAMTACRKNNGNSGQSTDIYVVGWLPDTYGNVPAYWKNGVAVKLASPNQYGKASAIAIAGSDVYIVGNTYGVQVNGAPSNNYVITCWKNGIATNIPHDKPNAVATGIAVSGTDVYISGYDDDGGPYILNRRPIYWKNGVMDTLTAPKNNGQTIGVAVSGTDVYFAGNYFGGTGTSMFWKNGVVTDLGVGQASAIAVSGSDVYVVGDAYSGPGIGNIATCWKNGSPTPLSLTDLINPTYHANAVAVSGTDVYVAGTTFGQESPGPASVTYGTYWKDGVPLTFVDGYPIGIAVVGNDIYVAGNVYTPPNFSTPGKVVATYWKNGIATTLPGNGAATAIAVSAPH